MENVFTATYSAEDNKLRLYAADRLNDALYQRVRALGFKWAPIQKVFVASKWTPNREDLCVELAGAITADNVTLVERADAKAQRLDNLSAKRAAESNAYHKAAERIAERFADGQPILLGHHSERSARRDQGRMEKARANAIKAAEAVDYWNWKAEGVERHANRKANANVRARRIKTLLAELRDRQRDLNHARICIALWNKIDSQKDQVNFQQLVERYAGGHIATGPAAPQYGDTSLWSQLVDGEITALEVVDKCLAFHDYQANSAYTARWINHILNRLAFERSELGEIPRFEGELSATILQGFAREHGAHKPKAALQNGCWVLSSAIPLPSHIADSKVLTLEADGWRDLMQASGYEVSAPKALKPPILNFKAAQIACKIWRGVHVFRQIEITKKQFAAIYADYRGVKPSGCGNFRVRVCKHPEQSGYAAEWVTVFLTDSKVHAPIESSSIVFAETEAA